jgi:hypothetical protein
VLGDRNGLSFQLEFGCIEPLGEESVLAEKQKPPRLVGSVRITLDQI